MCDLNHGTLLKSPEFPVITVHELNVRLYSSTGYNDNNSLNAEHLFIVPEKKVPGSPMQHTEKNIRIIRDKLSRIGIAEKKLNDEMLLASYSINKFGHLCAVPKVNSPVQ